VLKDNWLEYITGYSRQGSKVHKEKLMTTPKIRNARRIVSEKAKTCTFVFV